jgi:HPt (histidine-containing phosphotransfer) domain-containing protein
MMPPQSASVGHRIAGSTAVSRLTAQQRCCGQLESGPARLDRPASALAPKSLRRARASLSGEMALPMYGDVATRHRGDGWRIPTLAVRPSAEGRRMTETPESVEEHLRHASQYAAEFERHLRHASQYASQLERHLELALQKLVEERERREKRERVDVRR